MNDNKVSYESAWGGNYPVQFVANRYQNNDSIYFGLVDFSEGFAQPYCDVTVNLDSPFKLPDGYNYVDTNNLGDGIVDWLTKNHFAELTGTYGESGYCTYPLMKFNYDKIAEYLHSKEDMEFLFPNYTEEKETKIMGHLCTINEAWSETGLSGSDRDCECFIGTDKEDPSFKYAAVSQDGHSIFEKEYDYMPSKEKVVSDYEDYIAEKSLNEYEAEFGADGNRAFHGNDKPQKPNKNRQDAERD